MNINWRLHHTVITLARRWLAISRQILKLIRHGTLTQTEGKCKRECKYKVIKFHITSHYITCYNNFYSVATIVLLGCTTILNQLPGTTILSILVFIYGWVYIHFRVNIFLTHWHFYYSNRMIWGISSLQSSTTALKEAPA